MDPAPLLSYEGMKQKGLPSIYYINILGIPFIIGILYALLVTSSDCYNTRIWLCVESALQATITASSIAQLSKRFISKSGLLVKVPLFFVALSQVFWLGLGLYSILSDADCFQNFPEGFVMVSAISLVAYSAILVFLILYSITCVIETRRKKIKHRS